MHSGISVIAQYSHERHVNLPNDNGHSFAKAQRRSRRDPREALALSPVWSISSPHVILILPKHSDGPRVLRDPSLSFPAIPPASRFLSPPPPSPAIRWYSVSPCAPITRRNAHLVRGRGPIMVSNHSKLLSTHGFSSKTWATSSAQVLFSFSCAPEFLIWIHRPPTTNLSESTFDQRLRLARRCRRLAFLITVIVHASGVETPIVRWRLQC